MLGKVYGPYTHTDGQQHIVIVLHNDDGSIKSKSSISYKKYLEELDQGLHNYERYTKLPPKRIYKTNDSNYQINGTRNVTCSFCKADTLLEL